MSKLQQRYLLQGEFEIKLPTSTTVCEVAFFVSERYAELNQFQHIYITSESLILIKTMLELILGLMTVHITYEPDTAHHLHHQLASLLLQEIPYPATKDGAKQSKNKLKRSTTIIEQNIMYHSYVFILIQQISN
jgi:hypothetical protein